MKVGLDVSRARLRSPFGTAWGSVSERELLLLRLEGDDGIVGLGEAAPLPGYDGVGVADVREAVEACRGLLEDSDGVDRDAVLAACMAAGVLPQALAAIDLALWDLAGRRADRPVWAMLGASDALQVEVNATIAATDRSGAAHEAANARQAGFRCVKLKVGVGDDAGRLAAVRAAAGPGMAIRIDANGVWSVGEALAALRALEPVGIELCEEPVSGLEEVSLLAAQTPVAVAIDETARLAQAFDLRVCEAACLKVAGCGGITGVLRSARRAREAGYAVYLASTLDGPLGIAAALHAAAAVKPDRPCGLATLEWFERPSGVLPVRAGRMAPPRGAGLGEGLEDWYLSAVT